MRWRSAAAHHVCFHPAHRLDLVAHGKRLNVEIDDSTPYREFSAPVAPGPLTPAELTEWTARLEQAWQILNQWHPRSADEISAGVTTLTPTSSESRIIGKSSPLVFSAVGVSLADQPEALAPALVHKLQHSRLNALHRVRQVQAVINAVQLSQNLTSAGRELVSAAAQRLRRCAVDDVPADLIDVTDTIMAEHRAAWRLRHLRPDAEYVADGYARRLASSPEDAWIGLGLTLRAGGNTSAAQAFLDAPETTLTAWQRLAAVSAPPPAVEFGHWLGAVTDPGRRSCTHPPAPGPKAPPRAPRR